MVRRILAFVAVLLALAASPSVALAQATSLLGVDGDQVVSVPIGEVSGAIASGTFAARPACTDSNEGARYRVTDCADGTCAAGGGSTVVALDCISGSWEIPGTGGGGDPTVGAEDDLQLSDGLGGFKEGPPIGDLLTTSGAASAYQPLDSDLSSIAALTTTSFGRAFLELVDAAAARAAMDLEPGTDVQAWDANLDAIAGLTTAANTITLWTGDGTATTQALSATTIALIQSTTAAGARTALGAVGLTGNETVAGNKTLSGTTTFSGSVINTGGLVASAAVSFESATATSPVRTVASVPGTCTVGQMVLHTAATDPECQLHVCTATDEWTEQCLDSGAGVPVLSGTADPNDATASAAINQLYIDTDGSAPPDTGAELWRATAIGATGPWARVGQVNAASLDTSEVTVPTGYTPAALRSGDWLDEHMEGMDAQFVTLNDQIAAARYGLHYDAVAEKWIGNEQTYAYICSAKTFAALDALQTWTDIYVDPATGSDSNDGLTAEEPFETAARVNTYVAANRCGTRINVAAGTTFAGSDLTNGFILHGSCAGPALWMRSTDPDVPFNLDGDGVTLTNSNAFVSGGNPATDTPHVEAVGPLTFIENVSAINITGDVFDSNYNGSTIVLRGHGETLGTNNNVVTSHNDSMTWVIQSSGTSVVASAETTNVIAPVGSSGLGVLCPGTYTLDSDSSGVVSGYGASDDANLVSVGPEIVVDASTTATRYGLSASVAASSTITAAVARTLFRSIGTGTNSALFRPIVSNASATFNSEINQTTFYSASGFGIAISASPGSGSAFNIIGRGLVFGDLPNTTLYTAAGSTAAGHIDIRNSVYDDTTATNPWRIDGTNETTLGGAQTAAPNWVIFEDSIDAATEDQNSGAPPAWPYTCGYGQSCDGLMARSYTVDFGTHRGRDEPFCLPAGILPFPVCSLLLGGLNADAGFTVAD